MFGDGSPIGVTVWRRLRGRFHLPQPPKTYGTCSHKRQRASSCLSGEVRVRAFTYKATVC